MICSSIWPLQARAPGSWAPILSQLQQRAGCAVTAITGKNRTSLFLQELIVNHAWGALWFSGLIWNEQMSTGTGMGSSLDRKTLPSASFFRINVVWEFPCTSGARLKCFAVGLGRLEVPWVRAPSPGIWKVEKSGCDELFSYMGVKGWPWQVSLCGSPKTPTGHMAVITAELLPPSWRIQKPKLTHVPLPRGASQGREGLSRDPEVTAGPRDPWAEPEFALGFGQQVEAADSNGRKVAKAFCAVADRKLIPCYWTPIIRISVRDCCPHGLLLLLFSSLSYF